MFYSFIWVLWSWSPLLETDVCGARIDAHLTRVRQLILHGLIDERHADAGLIVNSTAAAAGYMADGAADA